MLGHQCRRDPVEVSAYGVAGPGQDGIRHAVTHLLTGKIDSLPGDSLAKKPSTVSGKAPRPGSPPK